MRRSHRALRERVHERLDVARVAVPNEVLDLQSPGRKLEGAALEAAGDQALAHQAGQLLPCPWCGQIAQRSTSLLSARLSLGGKALEHRLEVRVAPLVVPDGLEPGPPPVPFRKALSAPVRTVASRSCRSPTHDRPNGYRLDSYLVENTPHVQTHTTLAMISLNALCFSRR